jgi:bromodomain and WD repeat domain-containing protein 1/3
MSSAKESEPSDWLAETRPKIWPYFPQVGDILMYFKQAHEKYLATVRDRDIYHVGKKKLLWMKSVPESCTVKIVELKYENHPPRLAVLKVSILDLDGKMIKKAVTIKYHPVDDIPDFLVLHQRYKCFSDKGRNWKVGDRVRFQVLWYILILENGKKSTKINCCHYNQMANI